jgi:hypothetical protein
MSDDSNTQIDPFQDAAESLLYGDPQTAGDKLKALITAAVPHYSEQHNSKKRLDAELRRTQEALAKFKQEEERFVSNVDAIALGEHHVYREYLDDLQQSGAFDIERFRRDNGGNDPPPRDLANIHLQLRAAGTPGIRSFDECLRASARKTAEKLPGAYLRETDPQVNASRRVKQMQMDRARARGMDPEQYAAQFESRQPNLDYGDIPVTVESQAARERREAGEGGVELTPMRKSAFDRFFAGRGQGTDRRPGR